MSVRVCMDCGWPEDNRLVPGVATNSYSEYWCAVAERNYHRYEEEKMKEDHYDLRSQIEFNTASNRYIDTIKDLPMAPDMVNQPPHYVRLNPEPVDVIEKWELGFSEGQILKYLSRWRYKNGIEDLKKCRFYLDRLIRSEEAKL